MDHPLFIPYNKKLILVARENRKNPTKAEKKMWYEILNRKQFEGYKFSRQKPIDNFIADFYCAELRLVIEIDGDSHAEKEEYDTFRTEILQELGLRVIRYTNDDVLHNVEGVYEDLCNKITPSIPLIRGKQLFMLKSPLIRGGRRGLNTLIHAIIPLCLTQKEIYRKNLRIYLTGITRLLCRRSWLIMVLQRGL